MSIKTKLSAVVAVVAVVAMTTGQAMAAATPIDVTAATDGVSAAQTAVYGVIGLMTTFVVGKWALVQVKKLFGR